MRVTAETKRVTRERILAAARELFDSQGFDNTTTRDIAAAAGIATGTLFNYDILGDEFFLHFFNLKETRLGFAAWKALLDAHLTDGVPLQYVRQMTYFGDPAAVAPLDSDRDTHLDLDEIAAGTNPDDADTDDDGLIDDLETAWDSDSDGDGIVNAADYDSDDDALPDGLESGIDVPPASTDTSAGHFTADADPITTTNLLDPDTDGGGAPDGVEDANGNGQVDMGETDPNLAADDPTCAVAFPGEVTGLRVDKSGIDAVLSWDGQSGADPCILYRIYVATNTGLPVLEDFAFAGTVATNNWTHVNALSGGLDCHYLVTASSLSQGEGALGHYGQ